MCNKHLMLGQTPVIYTHTYTLTHIQHFHSSTALCKKPRETHTLTEAMKVQRKRRVAGPTTGCCTTKDTCIEVNGELCRQLSGALRKTNKQKRNKYIHTHTQVCMFVCMIV
jgi:hypothetical protein